VAHAAISKVRVVAAHDGEAELLVTLTFPNGGQSLVTLDPFAVHELMDSSGAGTADELIGVGWDSVRDALIASSGRFAEDAL